MLSSFCFDGDCGKSFLLLTRIGSSLKRTVEGLLDEMCTIVCVPRV